MNVFKIKEQCHQMYLGNKKQTEINLEYTKLEDREMQSSFSCIKKSIEGCANKFSVNCDSKLERDGVLKSSNSNLSDSQKIVLQLNNDKILPVTDESSFIHETNKDVTNSIGFQKEVLDEGETIKKIAEMLSSCKDANENKFKTKKRLQMLMTQNPREPYWNSSVENTSTNCNVELNTCQMHINDHNIHQKSKSLSDTKDKKRKYIIENNETFEEKSRFEEIEDKLEEMFAGIEDEQLLNMKTGKKNKCKIIDPNKNKSFDDNCLQHNSSQKSSLPTKAAKKSITTFRFNENITQGSPSIVYLKTVQPRRRLSIGVNAKLLKIAMKSSDEINQKKSIKSKESNTSHLNLHNKVSKKEKNYVPKNRTKNNDPGNCSEYKRDITYIKTNFNNKKHIRKTEAPIKTQQKERQRRMRLLSSDNDNDVEDKPLLSRDNDTKHRSPFILVQNNGNIVVVNTVTADDLNEKFPRSKKTTNNVYERKTVKGCYSSTLSNRYDAETADSTWICVFCKIGPHKKGLGDLFGPYIISSDCEEYRLIANSTKVFQRHQRSVKYLNETMTHIENNIDDNSNNNCTLGISQTSNGCYEVWIHEECAIWAPNIFIIGPRLTGLEDATWSGMQYKCVKCLQQGALVCCLQRDCKTTAHVPCARESNWFLDESRFWAYCRKHMKNKLQTIQNKNIFKE